MRRSTLWLLLLVPAAVAVTTVAIPTLYIQPFAPQQADWLARAYWLRRAAPTVTAVALPLVVLSALALLWPGVRPKWVRPNWVRPGWVRPLAIARGIAILAIVALTGFVTWFSRQNHFEWMFAPPHEVKYVSPKEASSFLTGDEMVMGIQVAGLSLAYPIRQMAYHHVVNDMFETTPVVVTY